MIRSATPADVPEIVAMVHELAEYEHEPQSCLLTDEQLTTALFGPAPALFAHVATVEDEAAGCALWFRNFSTWRGIHGVYLEDLFVRPRFRGHGLGKALLAATGRGVRRARVRAAGVGGAELERALDRLLPLAGRRLHGRVVDLPARRPGAHFSGGEYGASAHVRDRSLISSRNVAAT